MPNQNKKYPESFKLDLLNKLSTGEIKSIEEARRLYNIGGKMTVQKWMRKLNPGKDRQNYLKDENKELLIALGRLTLKLMRVSDMKT